MFTSQFPEYYQLMREPIFPLIIKMCSAFGDLMTNLVIFQSLILALAALLLYWIISHEMGLGTITALALSFLGVSLIRGYATVVLQQGMIVTLSMCAIFLLFRYPRRFGFLIYFALGAVGYLTNTVLGVAIFASALINALFVKEKRSFWAKKVALPVGLGFTVSATLWLSLIFSLDISNQIIPSPRTPLGLNYVGDVSKIEQFSARVESLSALLFIGREHVAGVDMNKLSLAGEASLYGAATNYSSWENCLRNMKGQPEV